MPQYCVKKHSIPWSQGLSHEEKLEEARNRYGRAFRCDELVRRPERVREIPAWLLDKVERG